MSPTLESPALTVPGGHDRIALLMLSFALVLSVAVWFIAIRAPLWLDETISYWQISAGFRQIWARQGLSFPVYSYILWVVKSLFGSSYFALRAPSIVAMLAATFIMYRIARDFFAKDLALAVAIVFCLHPIVVFAAIDARPYAFGVLVVNYAILCLLRWMRTEQTRYAIGSGIAAALMFYFQYLFGVMLPALVLVLVSRKNWPWKSFWSQFAKASLAFAIFMIPVVPRLAYMFHSRGAHVFADPATFDEFILTIAPSDILALFALMLLVAAALRKTSGPDTEPSTTALPCLVLAFIPLTILFVTSRATPLHIFVERYRIIAIPGIALCWGLLLSQINSRLMRAAFCLILLATVARNQLDNPQHKYSWRDAIAAVNKNTSTDHAPVMVCSDLPESNSDSMLADINKIGFFAPFTYYKLQSPFVPLPRAVNHVTATQVNKFLAAAIPARQRFLAMGFQPSWDTLRYISDVTKNSYTSHPLGVYDGVLVVEFTPVEFRP
ncbi:MAG: glycosyltransferase family 39 protein, partial [Terriglobales bacterium]